MISPPCCPVSAWRDSSHFTPLECAVGPRFHVVSVSCQEKNVRTMRVCIVVPLLARCTTRTSDCQWTVWDGSQSACATASCASAAPFSDFSPSNQLLRKMEKETEREDLFPSCKIPWVLKFDEGFFCASDISLSGDQIARINSNRRSYSYCDSLICVARLRWIEPTVYLRYTRLETWSCGYK